MRMQRLCRSLSALVAIALVSPLPAGSVGRQSASVKQRAEMDREFPHEKPGIGDAFPDLAVYRPDGKEVRTSELRGHYTVLTFGCLT